MRRKKGYLLVPTANIAAKFMQKYQGLTTAMFLKIELVDAQGGSPEDGSVLLLDGAVSAGVSRRQDQADQQKKQFIMQIDMEVKQQEMALDQQRMEQLMALQQQSAQQKAALEQQSMQLTMEYQQKKAEEEMQKQQFDMEKKQQEMQMKMQEEMSKFQGAGQLFATPQMGMMPHMGSQQGGTYTYGPNGELVPK